MSKSLETQLSQSLIKGRERADRLLRHVAVKIESYVGVPSTEMIIEYCTTHSIQQCTIVKLKFNCRCQMRSEEGFYSIIGCISRVHSFV